MTQRRGAAGRRWAVTTAAVLPVIGALLISAPAHADPDEPRSGQEPNIEQVEPGAPMPVPSGAFGYLATRSATLWLAGQQPADRIEALPVPPQYRLANRALAEQMDRELTAAVRTPGACVQIIIDPQSSSGNLFDYGVWSIDREYCPAS
ncbi:hypothetical protein [Gordonia caeni]|uniref:hypothetical protein n=1 Tax=Gordonia caeni TaxID=1007097 RepID=UPI0031CF03AA